MKFNILDKPVAIVALAGISYFGILGGLNYTNSKQEARRDAEYKSNSVAIRGALNVAAGNDKILSENESQTLLNSLGFTNYTVNPGRTVEFRNGFSGIEVDLMDVGGHQGIMIGVTDRESLNRFSQQYRTNLESDGEIK